MIPNRITIHHTASDRDRTSVANVNEWHKARFNFISSLGSYVAYHYVILGDGTLAQCRRDNEMGAHVRDNNAENIGICLTGDFQIQKPTEAQLSTLDALVEKLKTTYGIENIKGHRDYLKTECPGDNVYNEYVALKKQVFSLTALIQNLLKRFGKSVA